MTLDEILLLWANREALQQECNAALESCRLALNDLYTTIGAANLRQAPASSGTPHTLDGAALRIMEEKEKYLALQRATRDQLQTVLFFSAIVSRSVRTARPFEVELFADRIRTRDSWRVLAERHHISRRTASRICKRLSEQAWAALKNQDLI